jgi:hypothetical protein
MSKVVEDILLMEKVEFSDLERFICVYSVPLSVYPQNSE